MFPVLPDPELSLGLHQVTSRGAEAVSHPHLVTLMNRLAPMSVHLPCLPPYWAPRGGGLARPWLVQILGVETLTCLSGDSAPTPLGSPVQNNGGFRVPLM